MTKYSSQEIRRPTTSVLITSISGGVRREKSDVVITEEPLEIRLGDLWNEPYSYATIMRTPGNDFELVAGFLFSDHVINAREDIHTICYCDLPLDVTQKYNIVTVTLKVPVPSNRQRQKTIDSACGVCANTTLEEIGLSFDKSDILPIEVGINVVLGLPAKLRKQQRYFNTTGGVHAVGLFSQSGELKYIREDVGRHNALDKVLGACVLAGYRDLSNCIIVLSGRVAYELINKAARAKVPTIVAIGAPSSLAVKLSNRAGITLCGFTSDTTVNIYTYPSRILTVGPPTRQL